MKNKNEIAVFSLSGIDAILWPPNYLMDRNSRVREERQKVYPNIAITSLHEKNIRHESEIGWSYLHFINFPPLKPKSLGFEC